MRDREGGRRKEERKGEGEKERECMRVCKYAFCVCSVYSQLVLKFLRVHVVVSQSRHAHTTRTCVVRRLSEVVGRGR